MAMIRIARPAVMIAALALAGPTALAACTSSSTGQGGGAPSTALGGAFGTIPAAATGTQHAGTITWAESSGTAPTWILPIVLRPRARLTDTTQFQYQMWRPLYWFSNGVAAYPDDGDEPGLRPRCGPTATRPSASRSRATINGPTASRSPPGTCSSSSTRSRRPSTRTRPTGRSYSPGLGIPDQVASVTTPNASTVVFTMKKAVNPGWFLDDELPTLSPMPVARLGQGRGYRAAA